MTLLSSVSRVRLASGVATRALRAAPSVRRLAGAAAVPVKNKAIDASEGFLQGNAANYVDEMYRAWQKDPTSVHISWQTYFRNVAAGVKPGQAFQMPPILLGSSQHTTPLGTGPMPALVTGTQVSSEVGDHLKVQLLVRAYQVRGHHLARLDPLDITNTGKESMSSARS